MNLIDPRDDGAGHSRNRLREDAPGGGPKDGVLEPASAPPVGWKAASVDDHTPLQAAERGRDRIQDGATAHRRQDAVGPLPHPQLPITSHAGATRVCVRKWRLI